MIIFTREVISELHTTQLVSKLVRNDKALVNKFLKEVKADNNIAHLLDELYSILEDVGNNLRLPKTRYRKLNCKKLRYTPYEAKAGCLRLYLFRDDDLGILIVIGGKKNEQPEDINRVEKIISEYTLYKQLKHN